MSDHSNGTGLRQYPTDVQSVVVLYTYHNTYGWGWHVQWVKDGIPHQEFHPTFEGVSKLIEGWVMA